jgi:pimeloyl-ACP methyl ester carboxylesterase
MAAMPENGVMSELRADDGVSYLDANGMRIAYETFGDPAHPPVLLITGLAGQMLIWPDELCERLAANGRYVVRADNRDVGLSTHLSEPTELSLFDMLRGRVPYTLTDMAADIAGFIEALGVGPVHVVGASMGGYIAQTLALDNPELVRTLTLIMTSTGSRRVGRPRPGVFLRMLRVRPATNRVEAIDAALNAFRRIGSPAYPFEEELIRDIAGRMYDRDYDTPGRRRQLAAVVAQPDRTPRLREVAVPTLVIHGLNDRVIGVSGGRALAQAIPGARFLGFPGMGHNLPYPLWPEVVDELVEHTSPAD